MRESGADEKMDACLILRGTLFGMMFLGLLTPAQTNVKAVSFIKQRVC